MFKKTVAILLLISLCMSLFSLDMSKAEPYSESEFPKWAINVRRSEIIFFGAVPITYLFTSIISDAFNSNFSFGEKLGISVAAAGGIVLTDIIIGLIKGDYKNPD